MSDRPRNLAAGRWGRLRGHISGSAEQKTWGGNVAVPFTPGLLFSCDSLLFHFDSQVRVNRALISS